MRTRVHAVVDVTSPEQAAEWAGVALGADLDGVFLISHARDDGVLVDAVRHVRDVFPQSFLGVNVIGRSPADSLGLLTMTAVAAAVDALWTDNAGLDLDDVDFRARAFDAARSAASWSGVQFGGVAFKYQPAVDPQTLAALTRRAARHVDVVTTSGSGTGQAIDSEKLATMLTALDGHPLALASGVTADNAGEVKGAVDHILVSTGIRGKDGLFDVERIRALRLALS